MGITAFLRGALYMDTAILVLLLVIVFIIILFIAFSIKKRSAGEAEGYDSYPEWDENMPDLTQSEFRCPECGEMVDGYAMDCPNCGVPFRDMEFICPKCNADVDSRDVACPECGYHLQAYPAICPRCGAPVSVDATSCESCNGKFWSPIVLPEKEVEGTGPGGLEMVGEEKLPEEEQSEDQPTGTGFDPFKRGY